MADVEIIKAKCLSGIAHGFLGRIGGVSTGVVAGLNVGLGAEDEAAAVMENRRRAADAVMPNAALVTPFQLHSAEAVIVSEPWSLADRPKADALVTNTPGLLLGIVTADCAPVLFADEHAGVIGVAHAGWRGAHGGVLESTILTMEQLGARRENIAAAIGPCILQKSYEVDDGFRSKFDASDMRFFNEGRAGHWQFDLEAYVEHRLRSAKIDQIEPLGLDTYSDNERLFSFRRSTHLGEANYGRQFSLIGLS